MGHSYAHSDSPRRSVFIALILLILGVDIAVVLAIYLLVSRIFW